MLQSGDLKYISVVTSRLMATADYQTNIRFHVLVSVITFVRFSYKLILALIQHPLTQYPFHNIYDCNIITIIIL